MTCTHCAAPLPDSGRFCAACGVSADPAASAPADRPRLHRRALDRVRRVGRVTFLAALIGLTTISAVGAGIARERTRSAALDAARESLSATRTELVTARTESAQLTTQLGVRKEEVEQLNTQIAGVRGTLKASEGERETLRTCFAGFLDSLEAASRGDRAGYDTIWKRIEGDCNKADRILAR